MSTNGRNPSLLLRVSDWTKKCEGIEIIFAEDAKAVQGGNQQCKFTGRNCNRVDNASKTLNKGTICQVLGIDEWNKPPGQLRYQRRFSAGIC
jgi:hypothetical protein